MGPQRELHPSGGGKLTGTGRLLMQIFPRFSGVPAKRQLGGPHGYMPIAVRLQFGSILDVVRGRAGEEMVGPFTQRLAGRHRRMNSLWPAVPALQGESGASRARGDARAPGLLSQPDFPPRV